MLGGSIGSQIVRSRTITVGDQIYETPRRRSTPTCPCPASPPPSSGMEAFAGRRLVLDLGGGRLHASRPLDLTIGP